MQKGFWNYYQRSFTRARYIAREILFFLNVRGFDYILEVMGSTVDINRNGRVVGAGFDTDLDRMGMRLALIIERDSVHEKILLKRAEKKS